MPDEPTEKQFDDIRTDVKKSEALDKSKDLDDRFRVDPERRVGASENWDRLHKENQNHEG